MNMPAASREDMRRGACPSLSAPMPTGDGLLVRLRPEDGALTPRQLRGLAQLAGEHGNGILEITARGNLQIRGLTEASAGRLAQGVAALAIEPRTGIPVEASPLAGLDREEIANAAPLAAAIRRAVSAAGLEARLGPKVTVVVEGGGRIGLEALTADVRISAICLPQGVAWRISLAGTAASAKPVGIRGEAEVPRAVVALLAAIARKGIRARGGDLVSARAPVHESPAGAGSQTGVALAGRTGGRWFRPRTENRDLIGPVDLNDGTQALSIGLAFGQIGAEELTRFALAAEDAASGAIRLAPHRRLLLLGVPFPSLAPLAEAACRAGMITRDDDPRLRMAACAGAPACRSAFFDTKALAARLARLVGDEGLHVSGCPKRCADPLGTGPAIIGVSESEAEVVVLGTSRRIPFAEAADLAPVLAAAGSGGRPPSPQARFAEATHP